MRLVFRSLLAVTAVTLILSPALAFAGVVINEIDYDQPSIDNAEWIELYNPDATPQSLDGLDLVLLNGSLTGTCAEYCRVALDGFTIPAGGYLVFGQHACAVAPLCATSNAIQNGAPDAVVIQDQTSGNYVDSVEYESDLVNTVCDNLKLTSATDDAGTGADPLGSIQLCGADWIFATGTPCAQNDCPVPVQDVRWGGIKSIFRD